MTEEADQGVGVDLVADAEAFLLLDVKHDINRLLPGRRLGAVVVALLACLVLCHSLGQRPMIVGIGYYLSPGIRAGRGAIDVERRLVPVTHADEPGEALLYVREEALP